MRTRNIIFLAMCTLVLFFVCQSVFAAYVDLKGGDVVARAPCLGDDGKRYLCVAVNKDGKQYGVVVDEKGEHSIYLIEGEKATLLWSRKSL